MPHAILIPAYCPGPPLVALVHELRLHHHLILLIDDGSGAEYAELFASLAALPGVELLRHELNRGKGAALKTGMAHILANHPELTFLVTADADGQHAPADITRVAEESEAHPDSLVLGSRQFTGPVPLRSRVGNELTRRVARLAVGYSLRDTQTGLRGIPVRLIPVLLRSPSNGYEFELDMLIACRQLRFPLHEVPIQTIYEEGNKSSHFDPVRDSMRIYFVLLRFSLVSLATALIDNGIFLLAYHASSSLLASQASGRCAAVLFQYTMTRRAVFFSQEPHRQALPRFLALVALSGTISYFCIRAEVAFLPVGVLAAKLLTESALFFLNFFVLRDRVFRRKPLPGAALEQAAFTSARH